MSRGDHAIGSSKRNLVLKTAGSIRVLVGDKYYTLNFKNENEESSENDSSESTIDDEVVDLDSVNDSYESVIVVSSKDYYDNNNYPGDGKVIFTLDGGMYYTSNGVLNKYISDVKIDLPKEFNDTISFNNPVPFKINSNNLIQNLNSRFLEGYSSSDFMKNGSTIKINNLIVDNIESNDGNFYYKDGEYSIKPFVPELFFINNKVKIGNGVNIISSQEIEYSKGLPHENSLLEDFLNVIESFYLSEGYTPYYYFTNLFGYDDSLDLTPISKYSEYKQIEAISKMSDILLYKKDSQLWNNEVILDGEKYSLKDIGNNVVNISNLPYKKASYILTVDSTDHLNIYDEFKIKITEYFRTDINNNVDSSCYSENTYLNSKDIEANCIITKIDRLNNKISITTDYESYIYNSSTLNNYEFKYEGEIYKYKSYDIEDQECIKSDINIQYINSGDSIIGNLSGESLDEFEDDLSGYGLIMNGNTYLYYPYINTADIQKSNIKSSEIIESIINTCNINESNIINSRIINNIEYIKLEKQDEKIDYIIDIENNLNYSILSNENNIILPNTNTNGLIINIYFIDYTNFSVNGNYTNINAGSYISYRNIPVNKDEYKWIKIN